MKKQIKILTQAAMLALIVSSCARDLSSTTYTDTATAGIVYEGTVISARPVKVKDSDKLGEKPGVGTLAGGVAGGVGGSMIGGGKGSVLGAVGGALAGAVLGTAAQDQLSTSTGMEYLVKLSKDSMDSYQQNNDTLIKNGNDRNVADKVRNSTSTKLKSNIISVVQGTDNPIAVGRKVYIIYNDNRPRVVAAD